MTPIRQILEKYSKQLGKQKWLFEDKFDLVEKEILALTEPTDFIMNISGDAEIISKNVLKDSEKL